MAELGPGGRWVVVKEIKADPGGSMAIVESEMYRSPCQTHNPGMPVYSKKELGMVKSLPHNAEMFRAVQKVKRVFDGAKVIEARKAS